MPKHHHSKFQVSHTTQKGKTPFGRKTIKHLISDANFTFETETENRHSRNKINNLINFLSVVFAVLPLRFIFFNFFVLSCFFVFFCVCLVQFWTFIRALILFHLHDAWLQHIGVISKKGKFP